MHNFSPKYSYSLIVNNKHVCACVLACMCKIIFQSVFMERKAFAKICAKYWV